MASAAGEKADRRGEGSAAGGAWVRLGGSFRRGRAFPGGGRAHGDEGGSPCVVGNYMMSRQGPWPGRELWCSTTNGFRRGPIRTRQVWPACTTPCWAVSTISP